MCLFYAAAQQEFPRRQPTCTARGRHGKIQMSQDALLMWLLGKVQLHVLFWCFSSRPKFVYFIYILVFGIFQIHLQRKKNLINLIDSLSIL